MSWHLATACISRPRVRTAPQELSVFVLGVQACDAVSNTYNGVTTMAGDAVHCVTNTAGDAVKHVTDTTGRVVESAKSTAGSTVEGAKVRSMEHDRGYFSPF